MESHNAYDPSRSSDLCRDLALIVGVMLMVRRHTDIQDDAAWQRGKENAIRRNARQGKAQRWLAEDPTRQAVIDFVSVQNGAAGFLGKMAESLLEWGSLTAGQESAVRKIMADRVAKKAEYAARDAASQHVGTIGARITLTATVQFITGFDSQYGYTTVTTLRDDVGNLYVFKGVPLAMERVHEMHGHAFFEPAKRGDVVTVKGTIKAHTVYNGAKQTQLNRPKVESITSPVKVAPAPATPLVDVVVHEAGEPLPRFVQKGESIHRIWLVCCDRANGTVDSYPQQFTSEAEANQAMADIKAGSTKYLLGWYLAGVDYLHVDRQY